MIILQLLLYCLLFTVMVKLFVIGGAINGLYFYPKEVQDRAIALGMTDRETVSRKRKWFMTVFCLVMFIALVLIIGVCGMVFLLLAQRTGRHCCFSK